MASGRRLDYVIFDVDGTLADNTGPQGAWTLAMQAGFRAGGVEPPDLPTYYAEMAAGGSYLAPYQNRGITDFAPVLEAYVRTYRAHVHTVEPAPGAAETLSRLQGLGVRCDIVTSQVEELFWATLDRLGSLRDYFTNIHAQVSKKGPLMRQLAKRAGVALRRCAYVGDTPADVPAAQEAGILSIIYNPYHLPDTLFETNPPDFLIRQFPTIATIAEGQ